MKGGFIPPFLFSLPEINLGKNQENIKGDFLDNFIFHFYSFLVDIA